MLSGDLIFVSRVAATAESLGGRVDVVPDTERAVSQLQDHPYACLIVDLSLEGLKVHELIAAMPDPTHPPVIAFGPHVATVRLQEAADAGCAAVMPRSRFSSNLKAILSEYLDPPEKTTSDS